MVVEIINSPVPLYTTRAVFHMLDKDERYFLVVQRSSADSYLPGLWEFPGGKVDVVPHFYSEARREVEEEVFGLPLIENFYLDFILKETGKEGKYFGRPIRYLIFFGCLVPPTFALLDQLKPGPDHQAIALLRQAELLEKKLTPISRLIISELIKAL